MPESGGDDRQVAGEVPVGEVHGLLALLGDADGGDADVELAVGDRGQKAGEVLAGEDDVVDADALGDVVEELDVEAGEVPRLVGERVGLGVAEAGDPDGAGLDQAVGVVG